MATNNHNHVSLIGRLTRDPEISYTSGNVLICKFSIASNKSYKKSTGDVVEHVDFFEIVAWSKLGEVIGQYQKKGAKIFVEGRLDQQRWQDKDGNNRSKIVVTAKTVEFLEPRKDGATSPAPLPGPTPEASPGAGPSNDIPVPDPEWSEKDEGDVPF